MGEIRINPPCGECRFCRKAWGVDPAVEGLIACRHPRTLAVWTYVETQGRRFRPLEEQALVALDITIDAEAVRRGWGEWPVRFPDGSITTCIGYQGVERGSNRD